MRRTRHALLFSVVLATGLVAPTGAAAADPPAPAGAHDEILVRYRAGATAAQRRGLTRDLALTVVSTSADGRTEVVRGRGVSPATVRRRLEADPRVAAFAPNHRRELVDEITDEQFFSSEWGMHNTGQPLNGTEPQTGVPDIDIDGLEALRVTRGDANMVVAVIDDGVDFDHPDLAARAWTHPTQPGVHGWDFCDDDSDPSPAAGDGHGTHVAGTIAASLDGDGVVGVAPGVQVMALRAFDDGTGCSAGGPSGSDALIVQAIDYARSFGVPIINASWGGTGASDVLDAAIAESGALFVAAAGNAGVDLDAPNNDFYPAESIAPNVLSVGAIDQTGQLAEFSNFGATAVDLVAPGVNILSTHPPEAGPFGCSAPCFAWMAGTSMAAPHVAGVAALAASTMASPPSAVALRSHVLGRALPLAAAGCLTSSGRLVNALRAVTSAGPTAIPPCSWRFDVGSVVGSGISSTLSWPAATGSLSGVSYAVLRRRDSGPWSTVATQTSRSIRQSLSLGTEYRYALRTRSSNGSLGPIAYAQSVNPTLFQENTSLARYSGTWSRTSSSTASNGSLRTSTSAGAWVEFKRSAMAIAVVGRRGPTSGKARVYVDGVLVSTIDLYRSSSQSRVVLFSRSWTTVSPHTVRVVVSGTSGRPRIDIDGFAVLR